MDVATAIEKICEVGKKNLSLLPAIDAIIEYVANRESYVKRLLTDEQILEFALRSIEAKDYNMETLEGEVIVAYVMDRHGDDISSEDLNIKANEIVTNHALKVLCEDGLLSPDFEKSSDSDMYYFVSDELTDILTKE